jgi:hypothetical protein
MIYGANVSERENQSNLKKNALEPLAKLHPRSLTNIRSVPQRDTELRSFASVLAASVDIRGSPPTSGKPVASPPLRAGAR